MSLSQSPKIVTDGLVFYYDMGNTQKSWKGKPTTNFAHIRNPRLDASYASYSATASGSWNANHPDAIRVYNSSGTEISNKTNTGVPDWTNAYHAIWTFDSVLNKPVVTMRDYDGQWKADSFGLDQTFTSMGLGYGNTYTISWLQWTDNLNKSANAGLYGQNTSATNGFHDGQSNAQTSSYNTRTHTWQRVYATFTVSNVWNLTASLSCYMYGYFGGRGTVKIADVQIEAGTLSGFSDKSSRSNAEALLDLVGGNSITATSLTYDSDGSFSFSGSNYASNSNPSLPTGTGDKTIIVWCRPDSVGQAANSYTGLVAYGGRTASTPSDAILLCLNTTNATTWGVGSAYWSNDYNPGTALPVIKDAWNMVGIIARGAPTTNNTTLICGNSNGLSTLTGSSSNYTRGLNTTSVNLTIGCTDVGGGRPFKGKISQTVVYNRALSQEEILQNFNAMKERYYGYQTLTYTSTSNVTVTGNILEQQVNIFKNANTGTWNGQAYSLEPFTAPCTIEFNKEAGVTDNGVSYAMIGWNNDPTTDANYTSLNYASYPYRTDGYSVYNGSSNVLSPAAGVTWNTAEKLYVVYDTDGYIRHYNGSKLLYEVNYGTGQTVYVDSSLYSVDATYGGFKNVKVSRKSWNGTNYV